MLIGPSAALADWISPESGGSPNADKVDTLYTIVLCMGIVIFVLVEGLLLYSIFKFRARRRGPQPAQVHGNTRLEVGWTVAAAVIVLVIAGITFAFLGGIKNPPSSSPTGLQGASGVQLATVGALKTPSGKALHIDVNGQQYIWRYDYVDQPRLTENRPVYAYYRMVVPTDTTVILKLNASDVIHSWWIPRLGGKADATPGHDNYTWFKIPGKYAGQIFKGQCAELCGEGHADMRAEVQALPPDQFKAWFERQRNDLLASQKALAAQRKAGVGQ
ncbi:MAG: cytochrome c oxidase subunit II [Thermoleophilaceae bacterium]|nr:cytochrome c oxidase subunit II [Thermoleophilaceae bacterium]